MTGAAHPHEVLLDQVKKEYSGVFEQTSQGVYIYLDDPHWICNNKLAILLGYSSALELQNTAVTSPFLDAVVAAESQRHVVNAYLRSVNEKVASSISVTWKKKSGGTLKTQTIFVPISYEGTDLTIHFITPL